MPVSVSPGTTTQLHAQVVLDSGAPRDCAAEWSVSDSLVATVSRAGVLTAGLTGYADVRATCEGLTTTATAKVEADNPYRLSIVALDAEVPNEFGVAAQMEFLEGPLAGQRVQTGWVFGTLPLGSLTWPVKVRFTADLYEPREFVLAESTGTRRNPDSPIFDVRVPLTYIGRPDTDTHVRTMTADEMEISHPIVLRTAGSVQVRTWWAVDYNDRLTVQLWCGGQMVDSVVQLFGSSGTGLMRDAPAGPCDVLLRQSKRDAHTHYRVAITYPK